MRSTFYLYVWNNHFRSHITFTYCFIQFCINHLLSTARCNILPSFSSFDCFLRVPFEYYLRRFWEQKETTTKLRNNWLNRAVRFSTADEINYCLFFLRLDWKISTGSVNQGITRPWAVFMRRYNNDEREPLFDRATTLIRDYRSNVSVRHADIWARPLELSRFMIWPR